METVEKQDERKRRLAGVLMPVASLPSKDGVGSFGKEARRFIDVIAGMGMKIWQILPLNPLGYGNSPYQPFSSFAGDELYLDLGVLEKAGYLSKGRPLFAGAKEPGRIDYQAARAYKEPYLREAFKKFMEQSSVKKESEKKGFVRFKQQEWVYPYAVFMALKKQNDMHCWNEWPKEQRDWILDRAYDVSHLQEEIDYQIFLQYMFWKQWMALKQYANKRGVLVMGDIPFYVGVDSLDVWQGRENFLLDTDGRPRFIAGVPPDYFSKTGQRWGNPIYDWENIKRNNFTFWINRLKYSNILYDIIRIDHFRAFDTFWKVPASCETAVEGEWVEAPGHELLEQIFREMPKLWMVAEDLGDLREEVHILRDDFHLTGMNIAQFSLLSPEAPRKEQLVYTGTHDNQTVKGWYQSLDAPTKRKVRRKLLQVSLPWTDISHRMIRFALQSPAGMAIIPLPDILELSDEARLNTPGTVGSPNWEWQLSDLRQIEPFRKRIGNMVSCSGR